MKNVRNFTFKTLTMRLTFYYVSIFFCVSLVLYVGFYFVLTTMLEKDTRMEAVGEVQEMIDLYKAEGIDGLAEEFERESESKGIENAFFMLCSGDGEILLSTNLAMWKGVDYMFFLESDEENKLTVVLRSDIPEKPYDVEIAAGKTQDGNYIVIGYSLKEEHVLLMLYLQIFGAALLIMIVSVGTIGGVLTKRAMSGIRKLTQTAENIQKGDLKRRVPLQYKGKEIDGLISAFNNMIERIDNLVTELKEVTDNIAHDLRSPLTRIRGCVETTLRGEQNIGEYKNMSGVVIEECDNLISLINTMLEISETDSGLVSMNKSAVDLCAVVQDAYDLFLPVAERKNIAFTKNILSDDLIIFADKQKIQRVISNVLDNAFKYTTADNAQVSISVEIQNSKACCIIQDTGCGIDEKDLPHILLRFFRGDRSRSTEGNGLGLSLVNSYVKAHDGTVEISSSVLKGTVVRISFPLTSS